MGTETGAHRPGSATFLGLADCLELSKWRLTASRITVSAVNGRRCEGERRGRSSMVSLQCPGARICFLRLILRYSVIKARLFACLAQATTVVQIATPRQSGAAASLGVAALSRRTYSYSVPSLRAAWATSE